MITNMELASQVGEGDGAASTGKAWVSRRPESGGGESGGGETGGIGEKLFTFFFSTVPPDFQKQNGRRIAANKSYILKKFEKCEKAPGRLSKIFSFWY